MTSPRVTQQHAPVRPDAISAQRHVAIRVDCSPTMGTGHLLRCLALAEELLARGHQVSLIGSTAGMEWPQGQIAARGLTMIPPQAQADSVGIALAQQLEELGADGVVLDGYELSGELGQACRERGIAVMAMVDGSFGWQQVADLYVDQNLGATVRPGIAPAQMVAGLDYVLLRDQVLARRDNHIESRPGSPTEPRVPRLLVVFGGSDPYAGAEVVVGLIAESGIAVDLEVVAGNDAIAARLRQREVPAGQRLTIHRTVDDLPALARGCDAAISAAGSSVWEFLCLGIPTGVVCVVDNQTIGYEATVAAEVVAAVGHLDAMREDPVAQQVSSEVMVRLIADRQWGRELSRAGRALVDGRGRERVADAFEAWMNSGAREK